MKRKYYNHVRDFDFRIPETIFDKDILSLFFLIVNLVDFCLFYVLRELHPESTALMIFLWIPLQMLITVDAVNFTIQCNTYQIRYLTWYYVMWMLSRISAIVSIIIVPVFLKGKFEQIYYYHMGSFSIYRGLLPSLGPIFRIKESHTRWTKEYYIPDFYKSVARISYSVVAFIFCYAGLFQIFNCPIGTPPITTIDAVYYTMVSISSIGYGDITPTNHLSKVVLCLYIIAFLGNLPIFVRNSTEELYTTIILHKLRSACKNGITIISDQSISFVYLLRLILPANVHIGFIDVTADENPHLRNTCYSFYNLGYINLNTCGAQNKRRALDYEFLVNSFVGKSRKIVMLSPVSTAPKADSTCLAMALNCSRVAKQETQLIVMTREGARSRTLQSHIGAYHENCYIVDITDFSAKILVLSILFPGFSTFFFNIMLPSHVSLHRLENRTTDFYNERVRRIRIRTSLLLAGARAKHQKKAVSRRRREAAHPDSCNLPSESQQVNVLSQLTQHGVVYKTLDTTQQVYSPYVRFKELQKKYETISSELSFPGRVRYKESSTSESRTALSQDGAKSAITLRTNSTSSLRGEKAGFARNNSLPEIPFTFPKASQIAPAQHLVPSIAAPITLENIQSVCAGIFNSNKNVLKGGTPTTISSPLPSADDLLTVEIKQGRRSFHASRVLQEREPQLSFDEALAQFVGRIKRFPDIMALHSMIETPVFDLHPGLVHDNKWRAWLSFEHNKKVHLFLPAMVTAADTPESDIVFTIRRDNSQTPLQRHYIRKGSIDMQNMASHYRLNKITETFNPLAVVINKRVPQRKEDDCLNYEDTYVPKWLFNTKLFTFDVCCNLAEKQSLDKPKLASISKRFPIYTVKVPVEKDTTKQHPTTNKVAKLVKNEDKNLTAAALGNPLGEDTPPLRSIVSHMMMSVIPEQNEEMPLGPTVLGNILRSTNTQLSISNAILPKFGPNANMTLHPELSFSSHLDAPSDFDIGAYDDDDDGPLVLKKEYIGLLNTQFNNFVINSTMMNHTFALGVLERIKILMIDVTSLGIIILDDLEPKLFRSLMLMLMNLQKIDEIVLVFDCVSDEMMSRYRSILYKLASRLVEHAQDAARSEHHHLYKRPTLERAYSSRALITPHNHRRSSSITSTSTSPRFKSMHANASQFVPDIVVGDQELTDSIAEANIDDVTQSRGIPQELYVASQEDAVISYSLPDKSKARTAYSNKAKMYAIRIFNIDSTIPEELVEIGFSNLDRVLIINPVDNSASTEGHLLLTKSACEQIGYKDVLIYSIDVYNTLMLHDLGFGDSYRSGSFIPSIEAILTGTFIQHSENALTALMLMNKIFMYKDRITMYKILFDERSHTHTIFATEQGSYGDAKKAHGKRFSQRVLTVEALQSFLGCCGLEVLYYSICGCILISPDPGLFVENNDFVLVHSAYLF